MAVVLVPLELAALSVGADVVLTMTLLAVGEIVVDVPVAVAVVVASLATAAFVMLKYALVQPIVAPRFIHSKKDIESFKFAPRVSTFQSYENSPEAGMTDTTVDS
jgi:hypothetical protein